MKTLSTSLWVGFVSALITFAAGAAPTHSADGIWSQASEAQIATSGVRMISPNAYQTVRFDADRFRSLLGNQGRISLPMADGRFVEFEMVDAPVMSKELAAKFPDIRTWSGSASDNSGAWARIDLTPAGFHGMIHDADGLTFIDPYQVTNGKVVGHHYQVYAKRDLTRSHDQVFSCGVHTAKDAEEHAAHSSVRIPVGSQLKTYRLAVAATGEYTAFHGGTVAAGQAAIVTAINRVTGIYETELAIRLVLIPNNDQLIFTNPATDGYTNNNGFTMLGQNQAKVDSIIGAGNYDIGHVFSTGGGGIAGLGVVCRNNNKARGVTGLGSPIGDPFYVDYVAHEIGHQFGAPHSFNGTANACGGGNRNGATAYEPGSGSTIMAYAGICGAHNIANNSDAYFHTISFDNIVNYTTNGSGANCDAVTATGNSAPVVDAGIPKAVPTDTAVRLTGSAVDPDGDPLTYRWEQFDLGPGGDPDFPTGNAPLFRSFGATESSTRLLPRLPNILGDFQSTGEVVASTARSLTFRLTALDNRPGGGGVDYDVVSHTVLDTGAAFEVTSQNSVVQWQGGSQQTVTWNVAGTEAFPISCNSVDISISDDGGQTFAFLVADNSPNDGSEVITVPDSPSNIGRVQVACATNIFFDINNANIILEPAPGPDYMLSLSSDVIGVCAPEDGEVVVNISSIGGFTGDVSLAVNDVPAGATSSFSPNPAIGGGSSTLTIGNTGAVSGGSYLLDIEASGVPGTQNIDVTLEVAEAVSATPVVAAPADGAVAVVLQPTLSWQPSANAVSYLVELATDAGFGNILESATVTATNYTVAVTLDESTPYFWRVTAVNACGDVSSEVATFTTVSPAGLYCSNPGTAIPDNDAGGISDILNIADTGSVIDLNVLLVTNHAQIGNLRAVLTNSNSGTSVEFLNTPGSAFLSSGCPLPGIDAEFDDESTNDPALACDVGSNAMAGDWMPVSPLSAFDGENFNGDWTLQIVDQAGGGTGALNQWCVSVVAGPPTGTDTDGDGILDDADNCTLEANPNQVDADGDGYGNVCDPDLTNDGIINFLDLAQFQPLFLSTDPVADFNVDGVVNFLDFVLLTQRFLGAPGPSGLNP
ncbi:MAG: reprolysin-like metallopeptidase [Gammaproteobacteria bacterium]